VSAPRADFGNWIRLRIVVVFLAAGAGLASGATVVESGLIRTLLVIAGLLAGGMAAFLGYLYYQFADWGGGVQRTLWHLTLEALDWRGHGQALDVGTGNGSLAILLAQRHPTAQVTAIDPWGTGWEYSQQRCEENAVRCGVNTRTRFIQASAAALPFEDDTFDAVVSHFVFHEVSQVENKLDALIEALRVLRPGGSFAFHDMFFEPRFYGATDNLVRQLEALGAADIDLIDWRRQMHVPWIMQSRRVLGRCGIVRGRK
jgi:ubiquinone/menaquinone biosynthesis C-methylase UbiE